MLLQILCNACADAMRRNPGRASARSEEHEFVRGFARDEYRCDRCFAPIEYGSRCTALCAWSNEAPRLEGYEREYILPDVGLPG